MYANLRVFDAPTYCVLLQSRIVMTGVIFQIIFKHMLSRLQWMSILILTVGCIVKQFKFDHLPTSIIVSPEIGLILA